MPTKGPSSSTNYLPTYIKPGYSSLGPSTNAHNRAITIDHAAPNVIFHLGHRFQNVYIALTRAFPIAIIAS
jgi:hypothetical protein